MLSKEICHCVDLHFLTRISNRIGLFLKGFPAIFSNLNFFLDYLSFFVCFFNFVNILMFFQWKKNILKKYFFLIKIILTSRLVKAGCKRSFVNKKLIVCFFLTLRNIQFLHRILKKWVFHLFLVDDSVVCLFDDTMLIWICIVTGYISGIGW